ncbi:MAG: replicative DNA helicase [Pirellulales bacterium]
MSSPQSDTGTPRSQFHSPPHSPEAERVLLGALILDSDRYVDVAAIVRPDDFFDPTHARIYAAIVRLHDDHRKVDFVTLADALKADDLLQRIGGSAYLADLAGGVPTSSHAVQYAHIIRNVSLKRRLMDVGRSISALSDDHQLSSGEALEQAEQQLLALGRRSAQNTPKHIAEIGDEAYERYTALHEATDKESLYGIRTGFSQLDHMLTGLQPGHLVILAARPSMGKTSLAIDIARHAAANQQKSVAVFSLEMTRQELMDRVVAGYLGMDAWMLKKGQLSETDFAKLGTLMDGLRSHPLYIDDDSDTTLVNLRSKARRHQMEHGLDLLIIDYLQLIEVTDPASGENRTQQVSHISRSLKNLARELNCPIIALSQLSRTVEQRSPPIPILSDLRESGSIEQDADFVLMLYRQGAYNEDCEHPNLTDVYVRKNRQGPTGRVDLMFDPPKMSFVSVEHHSPHA